MADSGELEHRPESRSLDSGEKGPDEDDDVRSGVSGVDSGARRWDGLEGPAARCIVNRRSCTARWAT